MGNVGAKYQPVRGGTLEQRIRALRRQRGLQAALELAELVVRAYCDGESQGRPGTLRGFSARDDVPLSLSTLSRLVAMHALARRVPAVHQARHLKPGHLRAVLMLEPAEQAELLMAAERERWTVAKTNGRARKLVRAGGRGRRKEPRFSKTIRALARAVASPDALEDIEQAHQLDEATLDALASAAEHVREQCERAVAALRSQGVGRDSGWSQGDAQGAPPEGRLAG